MRNIIFVGTGELPIPSEKGAIEEIIWKVSLELSKMDFNVYIYNLISKNLAIKLIKGLALNGFSKYSKEETILHFHNIFACVAYSFKDISVKNVILTLHYPPWKTKDRKRFVLLSSVLKYLVSRNVMITAPSKAVVHWLRNTFNANSFFIPNGVDASFFHPSRRSQEIREKLLGNKDILISYVARIHPDKNQLGLLKAVNILVNNYGVKNIKIVLIGPIQGTYSTEKHSNNKINPYYILLKHFIEKKRLKNYVVFLGELSRKDIANILASSDIYVHTAITEVGVPLAIMEAMASGLPTITYDLIFYHGFLKNYENATLVKSRDAKNLAGVLEILINDKNLRKTLGRKARIFAENNLSWSKIVERYYIRLYDNLVDK